MRKGWYAVAAIAWGMGSLGGCAAPAPDDGPGISSLPGGWGQAEADDADVRGAARFALEKIGAPASSLRRIERPRQQVVAGMNYDMVLVLADGARWHVRVWRKLDDSYLLTDHERVR